MFGVLHLDFLGLEFGCWNWSRGWLGLLFLLVAAVTKLVFDAFDDVISLLVGVRTLIGLLLCLADILDLTDCVVDERLNDRGVNFL